MFKICMVLGRVGGNFMVVQWLRFHATNAEGSVPGQETKILHAAGWPKKKKKKTTKKTNVQGHKPQ